MWVSHGEHDDLYWRSSMSGGRATVMFHKGGANRSQCGDITSIHPDGNPLVDKFLISCKFYKSLNIEGAVLGNKGGLTAFWTECVTEAKQHNKLPMLVSKQNNTAPFICLNDEGVVYFQIKGMALAQLPTAGGVQILWLEKFLQFAKRPRELVRPRIRVR